MQAALNDGIRAFRRFLDAEGYSFSALSQQLGSAWPPEPGEENDMLERSSEITPQNVLTRLFLLGLSIEAKTVAEMLPEDMLAFCLAAQLLHMEDERIQARVVIVPVDDMLFASDAFRKLGTADAANFVLPASTHAANFLRHLTIRAPVASVLDLGCGCGIQALFAARHSQQVVATDISADAIRYTRFNAILNNIDNIQCVEGSLFDPVENQLFDLIISNPPFVVSPSGQFVYRDNELDLDEFCRVLAEQAPQHLRDGGHFQMLCEWVQVDDAEWTLRVASWVRGCDAWILHAAPVSPESYVATRSNDLSGDSVDAGSASEWLEYLQQHSVRSIHPGMMVLRKRTGANWLHTQNLPGDVVAPAGEAIVDGIAAVDLLESCDDESLLEAVFGRAPNLNATPKDDEFHLQLQANLPADAYVDLSVAAFLQCFDNARTVQQCIAHFASMSNGEAGEMTPELLGIVRVFVSRGFLQAVDVE